MSWPSAASKFPFSPFLRYILLGADVACNPRSRSHQVSRNQIPRRASVHPAAFLFQERCFVSSRTWHNESHSSGASNGHDRGQQRHLKTSTVIERDTIDPLSQADQQPGGRYQQPNKEDAKEAKKERKSAKATVSGINAQEARTKDLERTAKKKPHLKKRKPEPWEIQKSVLKEKFKEGWAPPKKLSPDALDGIRHLHATDPERFTTPVLAEQFKVSPEAVRRILKSKWQPTEEERDDRRRRWWNRRLRIWSQMAELGLRPRQRRTDRISDAQILYGPGSRKD
ncbi:hypothetical protein Egran_02083 [Elaphomyces granulatus]|uniref:Required for respiratory growth protein 9, mitochondrial n=1 Tax=Elaphomyces granulatus TaxID=519963 RepID=A0A232M165_9EURO|nr:hypothetical protein Egran_02083 [Elaphomyces granulatus]